MPVQTVRLFSAEERREIEGAVQRISKACQRYSDAHPELDEQNDPAVDLVVHLSIGLCRIGLSELATIKCH